MVLYKRKLVFYVISFLLIIVIVCAVVIPVVAAINKSNDDKDGSSGNGGNGGSGDNDYVSSMPSVEIATQGNVLPTNKVDYINSSFKIFNTNNNNEYGFDVTMGSVGIRLRGNSTMNMPKKPYRLKFNNKQSMLGSAPNKNWVLLADYMDPSLIRNYSGLKLAQVFNNLGWNSIGKHVKLYLNGAYQGVYLLCDQIDEKSGRLDLESDFDFEEGQTEYSFLVEISADHDDDLSVDRNDVFYVENFVTVSDKQPNGSPAEIKYPEAGDGRPDDATQYISNYVNSAMNALYTGNTALFESLVDIDSFIDYILLNELCANNDALFKSIYISKKIGEKMKFGPVWDFDNGFGIWSDGNPDDSEQDSAYARQTFYMTHCLYIRWYIIAYAESGYMKLAARLQELGDQIDSFYSHLVDYKSVIKEDGDSNNNLWYSGFSDNLFEKNCNANIIFFDTHLEYLREIFGGNFLLFLEKVYNIV